jgi:hypothetical protein
MNPNCTSQSKPTPVTIRPFLTEKRKSTGRRREKSTIPTDTSEKLAK